MVALHKDNEIYHIPTDLNKQSNLLNKFYYLKFEDILKSENIPYKIVDYEDYDSDYFIGRFAHALPDKKIHSKCFNKLYNHYGEKMWPNKKSYYYYDNKVRQYELLKKYNLHIPSIICNDLKELLENISPNKVVKSTYGAGGESIFFINDDLNKIEHYISKTYNKDNFFPCLIQNNIKEQYEFQVFLTGNRLWGLKIKTNDSQDVFRVDRNLHWVHRNHTNKNSVIIKDGDLKLDLIEKLFKIKNKLNTPNIKFDMIGNKVMEFSYIYGETIPLPSSTKYTYFDNNTKTFNQEVISFKEFAYKQQTSVLKHLGIL